MAEQAALIELAKRRGFFFGSAGAYGGVAGFYTFGPEGAALKANVEAAWRDRFTVREGNDEIEAPTIMPEAVFEASGHLETFDDMLVECADCGGSHRADHLVEDATDLADAESLPIPEVESLLREHDLACPECGAALAGEPVEEFNLMFETSIGPGGGQTGYLRPETAQGIFVEFPRLKEYARGTLPFGVTQIGRAYRNEISPRRGIVRVREFTQAELEQFVDPEDEGPSLAPVADVELSLYPADEQAAADGERLTCTVREAVDEGIVGSRWIAYYLGRARRWYDRLGIDGDRLRFRQHLPGELSHYSTDCWDAEALVGASETDDGDWIELAGFSDRGDYDLTKHDEYGDDRFTVFQQYDEPRTVERRTVDPDMATLGPEFGGAATDVAEALADLAERDPGAFDGETVTVTVDGDDYEVAVEDANFGVETVTETGEHVTPHVIEPSFGVGRTVYALLDHAHETDVVDDDERTYLALDPEVAPTDAAVFPLVGNHPPLVETAEAVVDDLRAAGLDVDYDDAGTIGRRYRRQDEVGTPFCVTVDRDGLEGDDPDTATVRERDGGRQVRLPIDDLAAELSALLAGETTFAAVRERGVAVDAGAN